MSHPKDQPDRIGQRLARLRVEAGYSQYTLAKELGVSRRTITYYELEADHLPSDLLARLSLLLGVSVDSILGLERPRRRERRLTGRRLRRRLIDAVRLPRRAQTALIEFLDALIAKYPENGDAARRAREPEDVHRFAKGRATR